MREQDEGTRASTNEQAGKERPARLIARTGREAIRGNTRTQGTRTDAGGKAGAMTRRRERRGAAKQAERDDDDGYEEMKRRRADR